MWALQKWICNYGSHAEEAAPLLRWDIQTCSVSSKGHSRLSACSSLPGWWQILPQGTCPWSGTPAAISPRALPKAVHGHRSDTKACILTLQVIQLGELVHDGLAEQWVYALVSGGAPSSPGAPPVVRLLPDTAAARRLLTAARQAAPLLALQPGHR